MESEIKSLLTERSELETQMRHRKKQIRRHENMLFKLQDRVEEINSKVYLLLKQKSVEANNEQHST